MTHSYIAHNLSTVQAQIEQACQAAKRTPDSVQLLAVSKTKPASDVETAYRAGQLHFGENYVQEGIEKIEALSHLPLTWHYIGPLQSNKTKLVANSFDWVHTVDRLKIATRLNEQRTHETPLNVCVQVNISNDPNKSGVAPNELRALVHQINDLERLTLRGLMTIPAQDLSKNELSAQFEEMRTLLQAVQLDFPDGKIDTLSMGMSGDLETAIAHGSTMVRVGTSIFGSRAPRASA